MCVFVWNNKHGESDVKPWVISVELSTWRWLLQNIFPGVYSAEITKVIVFNSLLQSEISYSWRGDISKVVYGINLNYGIEIIQTHVKVN